MEAIVSEQDAGVGVVYGTGRNDTLSISTMPFDDIEYGILADAEVTRDPAIATTFFNGGKNVRCKFV